MPSGSENRGPGSSKTGAKSAKAIKAAKKKQGGVPAAKRGGGASRQVPWLTIGAVVAVVALIGVLAVNIFPKYQDQQAVAKFTPSESNQDPSSSIDGVVKVDYPAGVHVESTQRVAYDQTPPFGGPHDSVWATCTGTVYADPIRTENAVHSARTWSGPPTTPRMLRRLVVGRQGLPLHATLLVERPRVVVALVLLPAAGLCVTDEQDRGGVRRDLDEPPQDRSVHRVGELVGDVVRWQPPHLVHLVVGRELTARRLGCPVFDPLELAVARYRICHT
ncbi:DUF3105 domain-containing protein [Rhodococcus hoagii]|nr:DUF3105 domain-containing protein [Prescottella equi]